MANQTSPVTLEKHQVSSHGLIPNTSLHGIPFIHYKSAFASAASPDDVEQTLYANGWNPTWRYTMYKSSHFHSTTHEALVVISGSAEILLGGDENPHAVTVTVKTGDAMFMPVGVAHRLVKDVGGRGWGGGEGFTMVGAYPVGGEAWDMCYGKEGENEVEEKVREVAGVEVQDPILGGKLGGG
ncbi:hypothetical protein H072_7277 [Dactylellina haptotyla CBS 200.50]|uniref:Cupin type-2 domain-containing protein n=1 Tax=Dactylellina haptotyla (strain CBS 200.50) TaxID=1284197 RepID=S8BI58_DACHA|nr:hypothetical protein H072_7277 [Dactylellina haptotyla CBS 200.50]